MGNIVVAVADPSLKFNCEYRLGDERMRIFFKTHIWTKLTRIKVLTSIHGSCLRTTHD